MSISKDKLLQLVDQEGTPSYVYSLETVTSQYEKIKTALKDIPARVFYATKANANPLILGKLKELGSGVEAVSPGEIARAIEVGFSPEDIIFTSSNISESEFEKVMDTGVFINIDSLNQLEWFGQRRPGGEVSIRINKDVGEGHHAHVVTGGALSKFGIHHLQIDEIKEIAGKYDLKIVGLHQHIGSHVLDEHIFLGAMKILMDFAREFPDLKFLDFGGGIGVPYEPHEEEFDMVSFGRHAREEWKKFTDERGKELEFRFEPGRFLVAESGTLLVTVTDIKEHSGTTFVGVNSGFNHLIRPMMYGSYHAIENLSNPDGEEKVVTIAGYVCESGDIFAKDRILAEPRIGDVLAIKNVGAYGYSMASDYNLRKKPKELYN